MIHTNFKFDSSLSSNTEKVFHNPDPKETVIEYAVTNFGAKNGIMI